MAVRIQSPFPEYAVPELWFAMQEFRHRLADDFGPRTIEEFLAAWRTTEATRWVVWKDEDLAGLVELQAVSPIVGLIHCFFRPPFWGRGITDEAMRLVFREIFGVGFEKVMAMPFADNRNVLAMAKRMGLVREGLLRSQTRRGGELVDVVILSLFREEFERCQYQLCQR
ncbi:MAG: GNAT family N-acetyltransferase [Bryobacteraceae bacterium]